MTALTWLTRVQDGYDTAHNVILIVLNSSEHSVAANGYSATPVKEQYPVLSWLWKRSSLKIAADGAANGLKSHCENGDELGFVPDCICGDLDSITEDTRQYFTSESVPIHQDSNQNRNDLFKALDKAQEYQQNNGQCNVFVYGAFGGRLDQEMQSLNALFVWFNEFSSLSLVSEDCHAALISPGRHSVLISTKLEGPLCGLIPLGTFKAIVTTHGLKWDLMNTQTGFGGLISSSNEVVDESNGVVEISTDSWLVWTTHMNGKGFRTCLSSSSI